MPNNAEYYLSQLKDNTVYDDNGNKVNPLDDDYEYYKYLQETREDPLSDDYCKYDNE